MQVREMSVAQKTREKLNGVMGMTHKRRKQIRVEGIKEYIRSKYRGCPITSDELIRAAGYLPTGNQSKDYWNGSNLLRNLIKEGVIIKEDENSRRSSWLEADDFKKVPTKKILQAKVSVVERKPDDEVSDKPYEVRTEVTEEPSTEQQYSFELTIAKRSKSGEFGKVRMGQLEMTDVTISTARQMINELMDNIS